MSRPRRKVWSGEGSNVWQKTHLRKRVLIPCGYGTLGKTRSLFSESTVVDSFFCERVLPLPHKRYAFPGTPFPIFNLQSIPFFTSVFCLSPTNASPFRGPRSAFSTYSRFLFLRACFASPINASLFRGPRSACQSTVDSFFCERVLPLPHKRFAFPGYARGFYFNSFCVTEKRALTGAFPFR